MVGLQQFSEKELLLDENETRAVLSFFFKANADRIEGMDVTDKVRGFAQGLLVEAIDASFAMGFVEALLRSFAKPGASATAAIKKFARLAAKHWFKHATAKDLLKTEIYESVRVTIALKWKTVMEMHLMGIALHEVPTGDVNRAAMA